MRREGESREHKTSGVYIGNRPERAAAATARGKKNAIGYGCRIVIIINLYMDSCSSDDTPRVSRDRAGRVEWDTGGP